MAMIDMGIVDGKRKRKAFYAKTEKEVQDKLHDARQSLRRGTLARAGRLTVGDWLTRWLADSAKPTTRHSTYERYASIVDLHLKPALGRIPLERLSPSDVRSMLNAKAGALSPRSLHHLRAVLRTALKVAMRDGLIPTNAAGLTASPRVPDPEIHFLGEVDGAADIQRFLAAIQGSRLEALYAVALIQGMRQGEILGLRWEDVDLVGSKMTLRYALKRIAGVYMLVELKTKKSRRTISPLPELIISALREHRQRQEKEQEALGSRWLNTMNLVFTTAYGAPLNGSVITHAFQDILKAAGLRRLRFHDLRHSYVAWMGAEDVPLKVIQELVGHSNINTTGNIYSHVVPVLRKEAAAAADRAFRR
jgi:integrase